MRFVISGRGLIGMFIVVALAACQNDTPRSHMGSRQALVDSIERGYERLERAYAGADSLSPETRRLQGGMEQMHAQMHGHRGREGEGPNGHKRMSEGRHEHMGPHHRSPDSADASWARREWHQQMRGLHGQMARRHRRHGHAQMARRHRRMRRRHRRMRNRTSTPDSDPAASPSPTVAPALSGEELYDQQCSVCHGAAGEGSAAFPPLAGSTWVTGEEEIAIQILLHGMEGPVSVRDRTYRNLMPAFGARLSDAEVAALLSYVRTHWGNTGDSVSAAEVRDVRAEYAGRRASWTAAELRGEE